MQEPILTQGEQTNSTKKIIELRTVLLFGDDATPKKYTYINIYGFIEIWIGDDATWKDFTWN